MKIFALLCGPISPRNFFVWLHHCHHACMKHILQRKSREMLVSVSATLKTNSGCLLLVRRLLTKIAMNVSGFVAGYNHLGSMWLTNPQTEWCHSCTGGKTMKLKRREVMYVPVCLEALPTICDVLWWGHCQQTNYTLLFRNVLLMMSFFAKLSSSLSSSLSSFVYFILPISTIVFVTLLTNSWILQSVIILHSRKADEDWDNGAVARSLKLLSCHLQPDNRTESGLLSLQLANHWSYCWTKAAQL
jgi:hypothetical protein